MSCPHTFFLVLIEIMCSKVGVMPYPVVVVAVVDDADLI